mgnify:CR=1 FL=1
MAETPIRLDQLAGTKPLSQWIELLQELSRFYGAHAQLKFANTYVPEIVGRDPFLEPKVLTNPTVTGTPTSGQTLTSTNGTWQESGTITRQWLADGAVLSGATSTTLVLGATHVGKKISVRVTNTNTRGSTVVTTAETAAVAAAPAP